MISCRPVIDTLSKESKYDSQIMYGLFIASHCISGYNMNAERLSLQLGHKY